MNYKRKSCPKEYGTTNMCVCCFHTQEKSDLSIFEEECHCEHKNNFVDIDNGMLAIIQTLNTKGFYTLECCEGHPIYFAEQYANGVTYMCNLCIIFQDNYGKYFEGLNEEIERRTGIKNVLRIRWIESPQTIYDINRIDSQIYFEDDSERYVSVLNTVKKVLMEYANKLPYINN